MSAAGARSSLFSAAAAGLAWIATVDAFAPWFARPLGALLLLLLGGLCLCRKLRTARTARRRRALGSTAPGRSGTSSRALHRRLTNLEEVAVGGGGSDESDDDDDEVETATTLGEMIDRSR